MGGCKIFSNNGSELKEFSEKGSRFFDNTINIKRRKYEGD